MSILDKILLWMLVKLLGRFFQHIEIYQPDEIVEALLVARDEDILRKALDFFKAEEGGG